MSKLYEISFSQEQINFLVQALSQPDLHVSIIAAAMAGHTYTMLKSKLAEIADEKPE